MLKPNLGYSGVETGKLTQQKICISHYTLLSVERSSCMNVEWENGHHFAKYHHTVKFQITHPPKFGSPLFVASTEMENWHQPL